MASSARRFEEIEDNSVKSSDGDRLRREGWGYVGNVPQTKHREVPRKEKNVSSAPGPKPSNGNGDDSKWPTESIKFAQHLRKSGKEKEFVESIMKGDEYNVGMLYGILNDLAMVGRDGDNDRGAQEDAKNVTGMTGKQQRGMKILSEGLASEFFPRHNLYPIELNGKRGGYSGDSYLTDDFAWKDRFFSIPCISRNVSDLLYREMERKKQLEKEKELQKEKELLMKMEEERVRMETAATVANAVVGSLRTPNTNSKSKEVSAPTSRFRERELEQEQFLYDLNRLNDYVQNVQMVNVRYA